MAGRFSSKAGRTALGGVLAAGSLAVLWLACITPTGRLGVTAAAGLFPISAVLLAGRGAGLLCWAAASVLGLLILPDKGVALMYLCFMGLYPVVKSRLEQCASRPLAHSSKPSFSASATRCFAMLTARTSPLNPTSPKATIFGFNALFGSWTESPARFPDQWPAPGS